MSGAETGAEVASPALGQHTRVFLSELGFDGEQVEALEDAGVVRTWQAPAS